MEKSRLRLNQQKFKGVISSKSGEKQKKGTDQIIILPTPQRPKGFGAGTSGTAARCSCREEAAFVPQLYFPITPLTTTVGHTVVAHGVCTPTHTPSNCPVFSPISEQNVRLGSFCAADTGRCLEALASLVFSNEPLQELPPSGHWVGSEKSFVAGCLLLILLSSLFSPLPLPPSPPELPAQQPPAAPLGSPAPPRRRPAR